MRAAISRPSTGLSGARAVFAAAARHGFVGVQAKPDQYAHCDGDAARFREDYGELAPLVAPGLILYWNGDSARWPERMRAVAPFAAAIGASQLCLCAGLRREQLQASGLEPLTHALAESARIATDAGCRLSLHNHAGTAFADESDLVAMLDSSSGAPCSLTLDTAHLAKAGVTDLPRVAARFAGQMSNLHLKDLRGDGSFCPLGRGILDLSGILAALQRSGYTGLVTVDEESMDVDLDTAFAVSADFLQRHATAGAFSQL